MKTNKINPIVALRDIDHISRQKEYYGPESKNDYENVNGIQSVKIDIVTPKPIIVSFSGDWHLGSKYTDHSKLADYLDLVNHNKNIYMFLMGDLIENCRSFKSLEAVHSQTLNPEEQFRAITDILDPMIERNKILGSIPGNHDIERDERLYSESPLANWLSRLLKNLLSH